MNNKSMRNFMESLDKVMRKHQEFSQQERVELVKKYLENQFASKTYTQDNINIVTQEDVNALNQELPLDNYLQSVKNGASISKNKKRLNTVLVLLTAVLFLFIGTLIGYFVQDQYAGHYEFVPNALAYKKPQKMMRIETVAQLELAKKAGLSNAQNLAIGKSIGYNKEEGFYVESYTGNSAYKPIKPVDTGIDQNGFKLVYNVEKSRPKPMLVDAIKTEEQLRLAQKLKNLGSRKALELGGFIVKTDRGFYAIPKSKAEEGFTLKAFSKLANPYNKALPKKSGSAS